MDPGRTMPLGEVGTLTRGFMRWGDRFTPPAHDPAAPTCPCEPCRVSRTLTAADPLDALLAGGREVMV